MEIIGLSVSRISFNEMFVSWSTIGLRKDSKFNIYRSFKANNFVLIATIYGLTNIIDRCEEIKLHDSIIYKVESDNKTSVINTESYADNFLLCIISDNKWRLDMLPSIKAIAFCITKSDNYCPECWSVEMKKKVKSNCSVCDGSGLIDAYNGPVEIKIADINIFHTREIIGNTERDTEYLNGWTVNYPRLEMGDYVYIEGRKYVLYSRPERIEHQSLNGKLFVTRQNIQLKRMEIDYLKQLDHLLEK